MEAEAQHLQQIEAALAELDDSEASVDEATPDAGAYIPACMASCLEKVCLVTTMSSEHTDRSVSIVMCLFYCRACWRRGCYRSCSTRKQCTVGSGACRVWQSRGRYRAESTGQRCTADSYACRVLWSRSCYSAASSEEHCAAGSSNRRILWSRSCCLSHSTQDQRAAGSSASCRFRGASNPVSCAASRGLQSGATDRHNLPCAGGHSL